MAQKYTVHQLASLSGVSVRTLHHYDRIGLLVPAFVGENGYRYYREPELLRLQQILFHREFEIPLRDIAALLDQSGSDRAATLLQHRQRLKAEAIRYQQLIETIDRTISCLNGSHTMKHQDLYQGFSPEQQQHHEAEAISRHGREAVERSATKIQGMTPDQRQTQMNELADLELAVAACLRGAIPPEATRLESVMARHRAWVAAMWDRECPPSAYAGLAQLYLASPEFCARFESIAPGLADYFCAAMQAHALRHTSD